MENNEKMYTIKQIANKFDIAYLTVYRLVISGKLKSIKIGRSYRIYEKDLLESITKIEE